MNLDWSTFILEIVNFLILVWILKRFLYKPILDVIARRRAGVDKILSDAESKHRDAEALKREYEDRVASWPGEREQAEAKLREELRAERNRQRESLRQELEAERKKHEVLEARHLREQSETAERAALDHGARFAARLLSRIASPEVEARLIDVFLEDLGGQPEEPREAMRRALEESKGAVRVLTAFPVDAARRSRLEKALSDWLDEKVRIEYSEEKELVAGIRVGIGPWNLEADLETELKMFREAGEGRA